MRATTRIALVFLAALTAGCVKGTPFEPKMCVVEITVTDSAAVADPIAITEHTLRVCARPVIKTKVRRP